MGERRTVTVLFTDLVGSTEQRTRLGDDSADELRLDHDRCVGTAVTEQGGTVVKSEGDGLLAVFGSASDALDAAVAAQQAIARRNRSAAEHMGLRTGLGIGDVVVEDDGDVFGIPVVVAARLCDRAESGQILCTDFVRGMAGSRGGHEFEPAGDLDLKGLPDPVTTVAVCWSEIADTPPLPAVLVRSHTFGFVGRSEPLDRLAEVWEDTLDTGTVGVLVSGEPGSGKTRLLAEFAATVHAQGAMVLAGRCEEGLGVPYQPFVEALGHWVEHTPESQRLSGLGRTPGELASLVPHLADVVPGFPAVESADQETLRYRMSEAVTSWLATAGQTRPVLFVVDDLHWATAPTLHLLRHVLRTGSGRLLVAGTYRETDLDRTHPLADLLADLRRDGAGVRIALEGLRRDEVEAFVATAAGHDLDPTAADLARAIHAETDGNPFFVESVLLHLVESGGVRYDADRWVVTVPIEELGIPEGVREVIGRRLARLSPEADELLHLAAVAGEEFDIAVVERASGLGASVFDAAIERATAAGLISVDDPSPGRGRFGHALVRATLVEEIPTHRRLRFHRRLGEAIEAVHASRLEGHLPALATHFFESAHGGDADKAIRYLRLAADAAYRRLATEEALGYIDRAVSLLELTERNGQLEAELWFERGRIRRLNVTRAFDPRGQEDLLRAAELAQSLGSADLLAQVALAYAGGEYFVNTRSPDRTRVELLERALELLDGDQAAVRAELLAHLATELVFGVEFERRRRAADEAVALARQSGDTDVLCGILMRRPYMMIETAAQQLAEIEEAARLEAESTAPMYRAWTPFHLANARLRVGDIERAREAVARSHALMARSGPGPWTQFGPVLDYYLAFWTGDLAAARAAVEARKEFDRAYPEVDVSEFVACDRALMLNQISSVAVAELDVGDEPAARKRRGLLETVAFESGDFEPPALLVLAGSSGELFARTGGHPDAAVMYRAAVELREGAGEVTGVMKAFASVQRECAWWAAILGDQDAADEHLAQSLDFHAERHSPTNVALDLLAGAWIHHLRGDDAGARNHIDAAARIAPAGWPRFVQRVAALERAMS